MPHQSETEKALQRLLTVQWRLDTSRKMSHMYITYEYFRRCVMWTKALDSLKRWPVIDIASYANPSIRADEVLIDLLRQHLAKVKFPSAQMAKLLEFSLHWSTIIINDKAQRTDLPDLYEPVICLYERMGYFSWTLEDVTISWEIVLPHRGWQAFDRLNPFVELDEVVLDKIDSEYSTTLNN
jgi:hypothetical protein